MRSCIRFGVVVLTLALLLPAYGQFRDIGFEAGAGGGVTMATTGANKVGVSDNIEPGALIRACLAYPLSNRFQAEFGYAYAELKASDVFTVLAPVDLRLKFSPVYSSGVVPYIFAGIGMINYHYHDRPDVVIADTKNTGWEMGVPAGAGVQIRLDEFLWLEGTGTYYYTSSKDLTPNVVDKDPTDSFITGLLGFRVSGGPRNADTDGDGLLNKDEKRLGTDPKNPDTDGDGLKDGEEHLTYMTNPLAADTDGDGLSDGAEVQTHKTDPLKPDTDGDGLNDGDEINQYKTSALQADTDGDGLNDGAEVTQYKTDPLKADTDGDTLNDGAEVNQHKTDPLKADTDGGSVDDGKEVTRGSNPLNPADDVPKIVMEVNKPIVLPGIVFKTGSAEILPASEQILTDAYETLRDNPNVEVEIGGHTDNVGSDASNQKLSEKRAESVKAWLVAKGISANRITTKGYGETKPIADNKTAEGKQQNRRIEFTRTK